MTQMSGRVAFITGAASGLGFAIAKSMAARGARLMLCDRDIGKLQKAEAELRALGADCASVVCDVTDIEAMKAARDATLKRFGKLHILVNNAGVAIGGQPGDIPLQDWRWIVDINLMGVVNGVELFTPLIKQHGEGGHIINTASMAGHVASAGMSPYNATKYAVVGYSEGLRVELAPHHIGVSVLCPGWVRTNIHNTGFERPSGGLSLEQAKSDPQYQGMAATIGGGFDPGLVADWVSDCVEANRLYIFTHPAMAGAIDAKHGRIKADYQAAIQDGRFSDV